MFDFRSNCEVEQDDYDWYANPIVQAAFELKRFARLGGHRFVRHHWRSQRGIGRRQQRCEQRSGEEIQSWKQYQGGQEPKHNGER